MQFLLWCLLGHWGGWTSRSPLTDLLAASQSDSEATLSKAAGADSKVAAHSKAGWLSTGEASLLWSGDEAGREASSGVVSAEEVVSAAASGGGGGTSEESQESPGVGPSEGTRLGETW